MCRCYGYDKWEHVFVAINKIWQMADCPEAIRDVLDHYRLCQRLSHVGHQEKRRVVSYLHCVIALNLFPKILILYRHMH